MKSEIVVIWQHCMLAIFDHIFTATFRSKFWDRHLIQPHKSHNKWYFIDWVTLYCAFDYFLLRMRRNGSISTSDPKSDSLFKYFFGAAVSCKMFEILTLATNRVIFCRIFSAHAQKRLFMNFWLK